MLTIAYKSEGFLFLIAIRRYMFSVWTSVIVCVPDIDREKVSNVFVKDKDGDICTIAVEFPIVSFPAVVNSDILNAADLIVYCSVELPCCRGREAMGCSDSESLINHSGTAAVLFCAIFGERVREEEWEV